MSTRLPTDDEWDHLMQQVQRQPFVPSRPVLPTCHHCWHPYVGAWAGAPPAPMYCCWCGQQTDLQEALPTRHGPYVEGR